MFLSKDIEGWREEALIQDKKLMIVGQNILLVPYSPEHVARYHEWMKDEEILKFTGSEPLSLDEMLCRRLRCRRSGRTSTTSLPSSS
mmetsp:Transcript_40169/g.126410  ORF Transcript_40169/g.126410 Transcript_40169/m.126410 type:complete len:87 (+) Transcript_40169:625-885(+)